MFNKNTQNPAPRLPPARRLLSRWRLLPRASCAAQCLTSTMCNAAFMGLVYARIARPQRRAATICFSRCACIAEDKVHACPSPGMARRRRRRWAGAEARGGQDGVRVLSIRVADQRKHLLVGATARLLLYHADPAESAPAPANHSPLSACSLFCAAPATPLLPTLHRRSGRRGPCRRSRRPRLAQRDARAGRVRGRARGAAACASPRHLGTHPRCCCAAPPSAGPASLAAPRRPGTPPFAGARGAPHVPASAAPTRELGRLPAPPFHPPAPHR